MTGTSKIEWTEQTWNPIVGCSIVSPGCTNCYAMQMAARIEAMGNQPRYAGTTRKVNGKAIWTGKMAQAPDSALLAPLRRKKPTTYFVNSMSDLFHQDVPDEWIDRVFAVMALAPQHTFQVLTKRASRMRDYFAKDIEREGMINCSRADRIGDTMLIHHHIDSGFKCVTWPLPNVWLGVSTERQQEADARIPDLLATPAAVRFLSAEPLLGPINLADAMSTPAALRVLFEKQASGYLADDRGSLHWVIVGGESGTSARPMHHDWARSLRDQCAAAGVPFFFKQWGNWIGSGQVDHLGENEDFSKYTCRILCSNAESGAGSLVCNVGKKRAGRLLDGELHDGMPRTMGAGAKP